MILLVVVGVISLRPHLPKRGLGVGGWGSFSLVFLDFFFKKHLVDKVRSEYLCCPLLGKV